MKKLGAAALVMAALMMLAGCNLMQVNPQRDENQVVAVVNGQQILKKDVNAQAGFDYNTKYTAQELTQMATSRQTALDNLISDALVLQKAREQGMYTFTDDEQAQIQANFDATVASVYETAL
ncbi:MAG: SurA N-terminal domain-containing protein, partial [Eubacteriales bacterium]|nr:SurA N-terminal domain-containing protein [Eubacteriales bacterium]